MHAAKEVIFQSLRFRIIVPADGAVLVPGSSADRTVVPLSRMMCFDCWLARLPH